MVCQHLFVLWMKCTWKKGLSSLAELAALQGCHHRCSLGSDKRDQYKTARQPWISNATIQIINQHHEA